MVELTEYEKSLPYVKYFYQKMAPIPKEKLDVLHANPMKEELALAIDEKDRFLEGYKGDNICGYCVLKNGLGYVANTIFMENVTPKMCDWWFGWHSVGSDLRYKLWDHDDHYYARADKPDYVKDPGVPYHQKTWGVTHSIKEDIGTGPEDVKLHFKNPEDFGYDVRWIGTDKCESMVCAVGEGNTPAFMTHKFYQTDGGTMFQSRFWMGVGFQNGKFVKILPDGFILPEEAPKMLYVHSIKEFSNLAAILPGLFAEEENNWSED